MSIKTDSLQKGPSPHNTIGCQELLATGDVAHSGTLKKQLTFRKQAFIHKLVTKLPWVTRYVALSNGSLYHYNQPTSSHPSGCYSLRCYNRVVRAGDITTSKQPWAFKLCHDQGMCDKDKYFCAGSEVEMKAWMRNMKSQLVIANTPFILRASETSTSTSDGDIEKPVYTYSDSNQLTNAVSSDMDSEDEEDDDDYLEIEDKMVEEETADRRSRPLPALPPGASNVQRSPSRAPADVPSPVMNILNNLNYSGEGESVTETRQMSRRPALPLPGEATNSPPTWPPKVPSGRRLSDRAAGDSPLPKLPVPPKPRSPPLERETPANPGNLPGKLPEKNFMKFGVNILAGASLPGSKPSGPPVSIKPKFPSTTSTSSQDEALSPPPTAGKPLPIPPPRSRQQTQALSPNITNDSELIRWNEIYWDGADKQACEQIIRNIGIEGVYMVRQSDKPGCVKTLVCFADGMTRKFMIKQSPNNQYFIKEEFHFASIILLLEHYHLHNLPNKSTPLREPFTKHTRDSC